MIILGIDPGIATTGVGVIEKDGSKIRHIFHGILSTPAKQSFTDRLVSLADQVKALIENYQPDMVAIEELFFNTNTKTAITVAQARGVIVLSVAQHGKPVYHYTPLQVKSAVCGYGHAQKSQVQYMVVKLLNLDKTPKPDDAADALGIAICHAHSHRLKSMS